MTPSIVRRKLETQECIICAKACYQDPELVELMASAGFDAIWICLEHKRIDPATLYSLIQACRLGGADALIRVRPGNYTDLLWLLESGARGIMLPRVRHPEEVREVVSAMKFPPLGRRGCDFVHAEADFGRLPISNYMADANRENYLLAQIEEIEVVDHVDAIAAIPGVDVLFVGPGDLSVSMERSGGTNDPEIQAVLRKVVSACQRHGKRAGIPCSAEQVPEYYNLGFRFFNVFSDYRGVFNGARQAMETSAGALGAK